MRFLLASLLCLEVSSAMAATVSPLRAHRVENAQPLFADRILTFPYEQTLPHHEDHTPYPFVTAQVFGFGFYALLIALALPRPHRDTGRSRPYATRAASAISRMR